MPVCSPSDSAPRIVEPPPAGDLDAGVIKEARRRQRLRRIGTTAIAVVAASVLAGALLLAGGGSQSTGGVAQARPPEPLPKLTGRLLTGPSGLLIVAYGNAGPPFILNIDRNVVDSLRGFGVPPRRATEQSPLVGSLSPAPGGVLAVVDHGSRQTEFRISSSGGVRRLATVATPGADTTLAAHGVDASWLLVWPRRGRCTLRLVRGARPAVPVPCGSLAADTTAGVWIAGARWWAIIDPLTGRIRARAAVTPPVFPANQIGDQLYALHGALALESLANQPRTLSLVDLISGHRRKLAWPSYFGAIIRVVPEPHGPLVAVDFGSPAYPGPAQAEDVWMLDTTTGTFTHLPDYPAQVDIKFSDIAWTTDNRLVIIAQGGGRTVVGLWKPGQTTLRVRPVPSRNGYHFVPLIEPAPPGAR
jgi:hypothetical protein